MPFPTVIDSSMLNSASCPRRFYWNYIRRIIPKGDNIHLHAGGAMAEGLRVLRNSFYRDNLSKEESEWKGLCALLMYYGDTEIVATKHNKQWNRIATAYLSYCKEHPVDTDYLKPAMSASGKPMVEFNFVLPISESLRHPDTGEPLLYAGRCDMIGQYQKQLWVEDDKTCSQMGASWAGQWRMRGQFRGYVWAAREHGIDARGAIIRGICIRKNDIAHGEALVPMNTRAIELWRNNTIQRIASLIDCYQKNSWPMDYGELCTTYSGCPYLELDERVDPEPFITQHFQTDTWSPLKDEEKE